MKDRVAALRARGASPPHVAIVLAAEESAAHVYIGSVERAFGQVGIHSERVNLPRDATTADLVDTIQRLANDAGVHGILIPTPLPKHLNLLAAQDALPANKDIEGISSTNVGRLALGQPRSIPATPLGGMELLRHYGIEVLGLRAVVIGRSSVVGWPMATLLTQAGATVTVCHTRTRHLENIAKHADLLVAAAGKAKLVTADMVKPDAVVLDFGVTMTPEGMCGDVDFEAVKSLVRAISPVPGGTGLVTAAVLGRNVVDAYETSLGPAQPAAEAGPSATRKEEVAAR